MVLHDGDDHLVAGLEVTDAGESLRGEVERLGCIAHKHHFVGLGRPNEAGYMGTRAGNRLGRLDGEAVETPQGVGVHRLVEVALRVEHASRALLGGRRVEIDELGRVGKQGELGAERVLGDVGHLEAAGGGAHAPRDAQIRL